jgi:exodeoxyribonuclease VII large subunit
MKNDHPLFMNFNAAPAPAKAHPSPGPLAGSQTRTPSKKGASTDLPERPKRPAAMTVSEACNLLGETIESCTPYPVQIRGEITNWKVARSGHAYLSLRDDQASLDCVMWKRDLEKSALKPADGMTIVATGQMRFYKPRGQVNFQVSAMSLEGRGELELRYRELCQKLLAEGLLAAERKRSIPRFPMRIGLITSDTGDALFDVVTTALRRFPPLQIVFVPTQVQGDAAPADMIGAIRLLNDNAQSLGPLDAILLVRGGGSFEDLWAFNDESLARTIAKSRIPIATGIGHEPDQTIADLVADACGPTPTGVAQKVVGESAAVRDGLAYFSQRMSEKMYQYLDTRNRDMDAAETKMESHFQRRLADMRRLLDQFDRRIASIEPARLASQKAMAVETARQRLMDTMRQRLQKCRPHVDRLKDRLQSHSPSLRIERLSSKFNVISRDLTSIMQRRVQQAAEHCRHFALRLDESHPDKILQRGYSITTLEDGRILDSVIGASPGLKISTQLADGRLISTIEAVKNA